MTQLLTVQYAARKALAAWLTSELASVSGGVVVEPSWFESDRTLPPKAISIIDTGPPATTWFDAELVSTVNVDDESGVAVKKVDVTWILAQREQPVQLDVWATSELELTDIVARLDMSLNKGFKGLGISTADPFDVGLSLALADGWAPGNAYFVFDAPDLIEVDSAVGEGEWRASYRGRSVTQLTATARTARIARVLLKLRLRSRDPVDTTAPYDTTIITSTS